MQVDVRVADGVTVPRGTFGSPASRELTVPRSLGLWPALAAGLALAFVVLGLAGQSAAQGALRLGLGVGAAALAVVTARGRTRRRGAWRAIATGLTASALGDLLYAGHQLFVGGPPPEVWVSDVLYLAAWTAVITGMSFYIADPVPERRMSARLDVGVLCLVAAVGLWFLVAEGLIWSSPLTGVELAVALAYLVVDLGLLCILATFLLDPQPQTATIRLMAAAVAAQLAGDLSHVIDLPAGPYAVGDVAGVGWFAALLLFTLAIVHPSSSRLVIVGGPPESLTRRRLLLLWAAVVMTAVISVVATIPDGSRPFRLVAIGGAIGGGATVLMATLVLWRLSLATRSLRETLDEQQRLRERLEHEANHDALTGLANRRRFTEILRGAVSVDGVVVFIDLDRFKDVNDRYGHAAGDEVLRTVAARLLGVVRPGDVVARLGGDEFAVLLRDSPVEVVADLAERFLGTISEPMVLSSGYEVRIGASVGTAAARSDAGVPVDRLRDADVAMFEAKRAGRGRVVAYTSGFHEQITRRLELESALEHAVSRGEFRVVYQPIVAIADQRPVGVEALLRWEHPTHGAVPPDHFIPIAETSGRILEIGRWVLDEACRTIGALQGPAADLQLNVNVSAVQLQHGSFAETVEQVLAERGFDPRSLTLEITESVLLEVAPVVRATVARLRRRGVRFAVDDFGTGYSALRYLRDVPLDELKIDRSFVDGMSDGPESAAFAVAMVELARNFRLTTVAEGIEREDQLTALARQGCDLGQGYLFSPPLLPEALVDWLAAWRPALRGPRSAVVTRTSDGPAAGARSVGPASRDR